VKRGMSGESPVRRQSLAAHDNLIASRRDESRVMQAAEQAAGVELKSGAI
jgi:hypothetical protein